MPALTPKQFKKLADAIDSLRELKDDIELESGAVDEDDIIYLTDAIDNIKQVRDEISKLVYGK